MTIWVKDVEAVHKRCLDEELEVTWPPTDMPWNVREMHVRHPDGHVFRISQRIDDGEEQILRCNTNASPEDKEIGAA